MKIRKATLEDTNPIAKLLLLAMEEIVYAFINEKNNKKAENLLLYFIEKENNQYSYKNCWVVEDKGEIIAAANVYDGAGLSALREPIIQYVREHYNANFDPENETQSGEYYIDSIGVRVDQQGKGIGSKMLRHLINLYVGQNKKNLGLLVEEDNPNAEKLYRKLGFKSIGKKTLMGKKVKHLQIEK